MKIAILTDSNAGIDINEAKELGVYLAYTPIFMEEETFYQDDGLTKEKFYAADSLYSTIKWLEHFLPCGNSVIRGL